MSKLSLVVALVFAGLSFGLASPAAADPNKTTCKQLPALTGDTTTTAGACATTTSKVNGHKLKAAQTLTSTGATNYDVSLYDQFYDTPTGNVTVTFTNMQAGDSWRMVLTGASSYSFTFTSTTCDGSSCPALTNSQVTTFGCSTKDGTNVNCSSGGGATATNGSTWNSADKNASVSLSRGSYVATTPANANAAVRSTVSKSSGTFYCEFTVLNPDGGNANPWIGLVDGSISLTQDPTGAQTHALYFETADGSIWYNGSRVLSPGTAATNGDVVEFAFNAATAALWTRVNGGNWNGNATYTPGDAHGITSLTPSGAVYLLATGATQSSSHTQYTGINCGSAKFVDTAPTNYVGFP